MPFAISQSALYEVEQTNEAMDPFFAIDIGKDTFAIHRSILTNKKWNIDMWRSNTPAIKL